MSVDEDVVAEEARQDNMWGVQDHPDGTGTGTEVVPLWYAEDFAEWAGLATAASARAGIVTWREILLEEVAEAFDESDPDKLRAELVQVAAVAKHWARAIDRRRTEPPC